MVLVVATALIQYGYSVTSRLLVILKNALVHQQAVVQVDLELQIRLRRLLWSTEKKE